VDVGHYLERTSVEDEFNRVIKALSGLVWTALPDGQIDFFDKWWRDYTGRDLEEARVSRWVRVIHSKDCSIIERQHSQLWVSANDGPGSTYSFSIPQAPEGKTGGSSLGAIHASPSMDPQKSKRHS
jgi:hypothetical protein